MPFFFAKIFNRKVTAKKFERVGAQDARRFSLLRFFLKKK